MARFRVMVELTMCAGDASAGDGQIVGHVEIAGGRGVLVDREARANGQAVRAGGKLDRVGPSESVALLDRCTEGADAAGRGA